MKLTAGETLRSIARTEGMPTRQIIKTWVLRNHDGFAAWYDMACRLGLDEMADQILDILDDGARDYKTAPDGREVPDYDHIQRSKLRVDARKWLLAPRLPKEFGDRTVLFLEEMSGTAKVCSNSHLRARCLKSLWCPLLPRQCRLLNPEPRRRCQK
jgi:hypothetical protein